MFNIYQDVLIQVFPLVREKLIFRYGVNQTA
jgi:hypothetical protein